MAILCSPSCASLPALNLACARQSETATHPSRVRGKGGMPRLQPGAMEGKEKQAIVRGSDGSTGRKERNEATTRLRKTRISRDQVVRAVKAGKERRRGSVEAGITNRGRESVVERRNSDRAGEESGSLVIAVGYCVCVSMFVGLMGASELAVCWPPGLHHPTADALALCRQVGPGR